MTAGDTLHPGIIVGAEQERVGISELNAGSASLGQATGQTPPDPARTDWTQPLVFSKADPHALYYANQFLFKTTDDAKTWTRISPDLTRPNPGIPSNLDETSAKDTDRNGTRGVIYTIAPSPMRAPMVWIGTDDGVIQLTSDDGKTWANVTPAALTAWSRVTMIEASHTNVNEAYASVDRHQLADFNPHIYRTKDQGKTWQEITRDITPGAYVHTVKEDPARPGLLFAGTERAAWISFDDGDHWQSLQLNLPTTSVRDFEVHGDDLIVATHGRGFWVIDDISPLRQITDSVSNASAYLFKPADAINAIQGGDNGTPLQKDEPQVANRPNGAFIDYYLKSTPSGDVTIEVLDSSGRIAATFSSDPAIATNPAAGGLGGRGRGGRGGGIPNISPLWVASPDPFSVTPGLHRIVWNPAGGGQRGGGGTPVTGTFTVRMTANGQTFSQPLTIKPDPRTR